MCGDKAMVFYSGAMASGTNLRSLRHDLGDRDLERTLLIEQKIIRGEPLQPDEFPTEIYAMPRAYADELKLPHLFYAGTFWVVSASAAEVLRGFDLGGGSLSPVKVFKKDRVTPIGDGWFCINFGNVKDSFLREETPTARETYIRNGEKGWGMIGATRDDEVAVSTRALEGPDIWVERHMRDGLFVSEALGKALKKARVANGWFLRRCRVIGA
jgi:hypothetical protein